MLLIFYYFSDRNETASTLLNPHIEENNELKAPVDHSQGVADDNITEILKVLKEHGNDITNLRIQQGYISGRLVP
jgi:hypothetical protein